MNEARPSQAAEAHYSDAELSQRADALSRALRERGGSVTTAESCTGGWIAKVLTDLAGSSDVFADGFVTYANASKTGRLGVSAALIDEDGAVSEAVVRAMAMGALERAGASLAIAVSGIAGPGGARPGKPVGTVWIGWASADGSTQQASFLFPGDREQVRRATVAHALDGALARLTGCS